MSGREESRWSCAPDIVLLQIFSFLTPRHLLRASSVCKSWNRVAYDNILWKRLFHHHITPKQLTTPIRPGKESWYLEYKRVSYDVPSVCTEVLTDHSDQVLHVSCSHDGTMFATSSRDVHVRVWNVGREEGVKFRCGRDMASFSWNLTQYSEFNRCDTLLLVSGVHFGFANTTSGEIAVFSLVGGFELQCRVPNKPYDIFGTWISDRFLLSGDLHCFNDLNSVTGLWISKASQEIESLKPIRSLQFRFKNINGSSIRKVMISQCCNNFVLDKRKTESMGESNERPDEPDRQVERRVVSDEELWSGSGSGSEEEDDLSNQPDKLLIFITGSKTYTPHKVGFKRVKGIKFPKKLLPVRIEERQRRSESQAENYDRADIELDLSAHIIGAALSPDHRYLYVNCRRWPEGCRISDPLCPPPISTQIDLVLIDLERFECVGQPLTSHRAFTSSNEVFFIFLDVSQYYVASGAEDNSGYLWERHYGTCLAHYPHTDVVNCVSFSPTDPGLLVTVSDDTTVKVWRSRRYIDSLGIDMSHMERATHTVFLS